MLSFPSRLRYSESSLFTTNANLNRPRICRTLLRSVKGSQSHQYRSATYIVTTVNVKAYGTCTDGALLVDLPPQLRLNIYLRQPCTLPLVPLFPHKPLLPTLLSNRRVASQSARRMAERECTVCLNTGEGEGDPPLLQLPCKKHFICESGEDGCLEGYFRQALTNERLYPPTCCHAVLLLEDYEDKLPFELTWQFRKKAIEYSIPMR